MGLPPGAGRIALALFDVPDVEHVLEVLGLHRDDRVLEPSVDKAKRFGINDSELRAVPPNQYADLVLERVAFVDLAK
jgi:tRNA threonylcarbamoyladenosine modification (KEOPS) complex Cgi121 subunit